MARAALQTGIRDLAEAAQVSPTTITKLEGGDVLKPRTLLAIRAALETAGVQFIPENGGGAGVRLRKSSTSGDNA
jgi:transcriptional regulator with XRE-family HTH domain